MLDAEMHEGLFVTEKDVLRHREAGERAHLLHDDGNTGVVRLDLILRVQRLTVESKAAAADGIDAAEHLGKGALAGAVFADQTADLAGVDGEGDVVDGVGDAELLVNVLSYKQRFDSGTSLYHAALGTAGGQGNDDQQGCTGDDVLDGCRSTEGNKAVEDDRDDKLADDDRRDRHVIFTECHAKKRAHQRLEVAAHGAHAGQGRHGRQRSAEA